MTTVVLVFYKNPTNKHATMWSVLNFQLFTQWKIKRVKFKLAIQDLKTKCPKSLNWLEINQVDPLQHTCISPNKKPH